MSDFFLVLLLLSLAGLVVGLIRPQWLRMPSRKMAAGVFAVAALLFFILFGVTTPQQPAMVADTATTTPEVVNTSNTPAKPDTGANTGKQAQAAPAPVTAQTQKPVAPAPATNPAPTPASTPAPTPTMNSETISQKSAVRKAMSYLSYAAFSHDGLVAQLEYDQFSHADAVYGADNSGADWNEQAAKKAKSYMSYSAFSRGGLIAQLEYDQFTQAQAEYGANAVGL
ncbi:MAG TPA: Ltp family lipoprotein [Candidatus Paceibacterota bacterium]|nr:Ltp family lipoprotein [Candidatus Paceibacterota bacterium]